MALLRFNFPTLPLSFSCSSCFNCNLSKFPRFQTKTLISRSRTSLQQVVHPKFRLPVISASLLTLDPTDCNIRQVLADARSEFPQIFDTSVSMTGEVDLADLDGPFVKIRLKGQFWHKRSTVLSRISNDLKIRIPASCSFCSGDSVFIVMFIESGNERGGY